MWKFVELVGDDRTGERHLEFKGALRVIAYPQDVLGFKPGELFALRMSDSRRM
ncbi:hypothetical protein QUB08_28030 [Microcoleus sp. BR0-C5]|uniref:hypothetical protein n=1 Tax=Microcoleus sp. BR0-C5 TaxID=2818713 RepID=UPI002FD5B856